MKAKKKTARKEVAVTDLGAFEKLRPFKDITWREVTGPQVWRPREGDVLVGYYVGKTKASGTFGQYEVVLVREPAGGLWTISGTCLVRLVDAENPETGTPVHITYDGLKELDTEKKMKVFRLRVPKGVRS